MPCARRLLTALAAYNRAGEFESGGLHRIERADHRRHATEVIGDAPAIHAAVFNVAGEGVVLPLLRVGYRFTVRVSECQQTASAARSRQNRDNADALGLWLCARRPEIVRQDKTIGRAGYAFDLTAQALKALRNGALQRLFAISRRCQQVSQQNDVGFTLRRDERLQTRIAVAGICCH